MEDADHALAPDQVPEADTGRRRRPRNLQRPHCKRVAISIDPQEHQELEAAAARAGLTLSAYVADAALRSVRAAAPPLNLPLRDALADLIRATVQVQKIGVNLNQAVAKLNATGQQPASLFPYADQAARVIARLDETAARIGKRLP